MSTLTIRKLDDRVKTRLRVRAANHGRSMEEEVRQILNSAVAVKNAPKEPPPIGNLAEEIRNLFAPLGGVELPELPRQTIRSPRRRR
jgi:plasmid stability protein